MQGAPGEAATTGAAIAFQTGSAAVSSCSSDLLGMKQATVLQPRSAGWWCSFLTNTCSSRAAAAVFWHGVFDTSVWTCHLSAYTWRDFDLDLH